METLKKQYRDQAEIELAWQELIEAIKPLNIIESKGGEKTRIKTQHHPAIITTSEFANWEIFG